MPDIRWHKSSYSTQGAGNDCLELAQSEEGLLLRESDEPALIAVAPPPRVRGLLSAIKCGEFDRIG